MNENAASDAKTKFFKPLSEDLIDPNREIDVANRVESVLQTLTHAALKQDLDKRLRQKGTTVEQVLKEQAEENSKKPFSLHKDCALAGFHTIARRPKHHLIASVLWLIDFTYRRTHRKADSFLGDRSGRVGSTQARVEKEYDEVLDILKESIQANYGEDEINAALDVVDLKEGGFETDYEKHVREQAQEAEAALKRGQEALEEEARRRRCTASLEQLLAEEVHGESREEVRKKQREELARFLDARAGQDTDGSEFQALLEESKIRFGPYALKLAEEFFQAQLKRKKMKANPNGVKEDQEKISFVKMEYFLYGVTEADTLIEQIKGMEVAVNKLTDMLDHHQRYARDIASSLIDLDRRISATAHAQRVRLQKEQERAHESVA